MFILVIVFDDFVTTQPVVRSVAGWAAEKSRCIESFLFGWVDAISITKFLYKSVFSFKNLYHFCISVSDLKILYNTDFSVYLASLHSTAAMPMLNTPIGASGRCQILKLLYRIKM